MHVPTAQQLRAARILAGLSRGELADLASIHISHVIATEAGEPSAEQARIAICRALTMCGIELGPDDWIRYRNAPFPAQEPQEQGNEQPGRAREPKPSKRLKHEIGAACQRARGSLRLTQSQVSEKLEISSEYYARIERGVSAPSTATLFDIVQVYALDLTKLLREGVGVTNPWLQPPATLQGFPAERFGAMCRQARKARDLVQKEVAGRLDISANFYARIERGDIAPSLSRLAGLVRELELDVNELVRAGDGRE